MSDTCLWNVVEAVQDASESETEAISALVDLLLGEEGTENAESNGAP